MPSEARLNISLRAMLLSEAMVNIFFINNMSFSSSDNYLFNENV